MDELNEPEIKTAAIVRIGGDRWSGLWQLYLSNGEIVSFESGFGARQIASAFGSLQEAVGKEIEYTTDELGVLAGFTPLDEVGI